MKKCYSCAHNLSCAQQDCPMDHDGAITYPRWEPSIAYLDGRRAGIEEAAKALESNLAKPGTSLQTRITPWVDQVDCIRTNVRQIRALLEAKT